MDVYQVEVRLLVDVPAFNDADALETVMDAFGVGENCGTTVVDCEYTERGKKKN